jgi:nucleotide-binding universal stress UspA family protein
MVNSSIRSVLHPTDLSPSSIGAFVHALRIALAAKSKLYLLHVLQDDVGEGWESPHVRLRHLLVQWGLLEENDPLGAMDTKLGLHIENYTFHRQQTPTDEILHFVNQNVCDLMVLATHGRDGLDRLLMGSVAEAVLRRSAIPTLFVPHAARGFVDHVSGKFVLRRVLVPVDHSPAPYRAIEAARSFPHLLTGIDITMQLLHVGSTAPNLHDAINPITIRYGNVAQTILDAAVEYDADFICMPTAGRHGVLDALRGSTTERVLRHAPRPLLAISAA